MGCLYKINFPSGKSYIGISSKSANVRWTVHCNKAKQGQFGAFYNALRKHGHESAIVQTLVIANDWGYLQSLERMAIAAYKTKSPDGYNMTDGGDGLCNPSVEVREKISRNNKSHTKEVKEKISASCKGYKHTDDAKRKIGLASIGNKYNLGRIANEETKKKLSESKLGNKYGVGNKNCLGRIISAETKNKISKSKSGIKWSQKRIDAQLTRRLNHG